MANTEKSLLGASQVAYLECLDTGRKNLVLDGKKGPFTVDELIHAAIDDELIKRKMQAMGVNIDNPTTYDLVKYSDLSKEDKEYIAELSEYILDWKVIDIYDTRLDNGFYGCVLETADKNVAIVAIRGSEGFKDYPGLVYDWIESDLGLLNSEKTIQTEATEVFLEHLLNDHILDPYGSFDVVGHSLGGNLATHFAIFCASDEKFGELFQKMNRACNFDGPGFSDEYIKKHKEAIDKVASKITHYKWSPIGNLLLNVPGETEVFLKTKDYEGNGIWVNQIGYYTFGKHHSKSVAFDMREKARRGREGTLERGLKDISLELESSPEITLSVYSFVASLAEKVMYQGKAGELKFKSPFEKNPQEAYKNEKVLPYISFWSACGKLARRVYGFLTDYAVGKDTARNIGPSER